MIKTLIFAFLGIFFKNIWVKMGKLIFNSRMCTSTRKKILFANKESFESVRGQGSIIKHGFARFYFLLLDLHDVITWPPRVNQLGLDSNKHGQADLQFLCVFDLKFCNMYPCRGYFVINWSVSDLACRQ
jgi:hypothetical protein